MIVEAHLAFHHYVGEMNIFDAIRIGLAERGQIDVAGRQQRRRRGRGPLADPRGEVLATERGAVKVNERMETTAQGVYAIGDLVGGLMLAHVASREGIVAASRAAGKDVAMDYRAVPRCTFTHPEVAGVGLTEAAAAAQLIALPILLCYNFLKRLTRLTSDLNEEGCS